ncbi:MAG: winged helix-turn-helix transcriptional regulator [Archaeoglobaceae archaeon]|nr:winged helix-turn-helix transcriptional regulator [Archaeoglobaceae archaeon]MCX8152098.1 winged helix-turn-helix transcriptional regulator [Archaeoglobaceae archaeon]MDW8013533.1 winged helix-turn-helix transcriptional regulator [Archaeoglobaceae archaeon]
MDAAEEKIVSLLKKVKSEGILQSEIAEKLRISKSTVSEILSKLEEEKEVVRSQVSSKSYRVWLSEFAPFPIDGLMRVGILKASEYPKVVFAAKKLDAIVKVYENALELTRDLAAGTVDVAASPLITQVYFGALMKNIKIYRLVAMNGSGVVFSNKESEWYGCSEFSTMEFNLRNYLKKKGYSLKIRYFRSPEIMIESLRELKGIAVWEPYLTLLSEFESEKFRDVLGDFVCCSLAANSFFITKNYDFFDPFLKEFDRCKVGRDEALMISKLIGFDPEIVYRSFESYEFDVPQEVPRLDVLGRIDEVFCFK